MKYHKVVVESILAAVQSIFADGRYADKVIEYNLKHNKKWGSRDRKFFAENVYDIVRHWRKLWNLSGFDDRDYLNPDLITEDRLWRLWATYISYKGEMTPDWEEVPRISKKDISDREEKLSAPQKNSWTDEMWGYAEEQGTVGDKKVHMEALNSAAPVFLRTNTLKISASELRTKLLTEGIDSQVIEAVPGCLKLNQRQNVFSSNSFKEGLFEVQDISSQMVALFLQPQSGERVIDACAGAGGKTLHIATLMKNKGRVIALDIHQWKLDELHKRARRNGFDGIETRLIEGSKTIKRLENGADRVLLDVPCSGSGVLRRNPDSKWKMSKEQIDNLIIEQKDILTYYAPMVKPGGVLVYSTCSFFASENEKQVEDFLSRSGTEWKLEDQMRVMPGSQDGDGFFMARLRRQKS